jgi:hypothetical protein
MRNGRTISPRATRILLVSASWPAKPAETLAILAMPAGAGGDEQEVRTGVADFS